MSCGLCLFANYGASGAENGSLSLGRTGGWKPQGEHWSYLCPVPKITDLNHRNHFKGES